MLPKSFTSVARELKIFCVCANDPELERMIRSTFSSTAEIMLSFTSCESGRAEDDLIEAASVFRKTSWRSPQSEDEH